MGTDSQIRENAYELFSSIKAELYDWATGKWSITFSFLLAICYILSADETIEYLPVDDTTKSIVQKISIFLSFCFIIIIAFIQYLQFKQTDALRSVKRELEEARENNDQLEESISNSIQDMEYICNGYLYSLAKGPLEFFKTPSSHERITIYVHDDKGYFYSIGRYSSNPDYGLKSREMYPSGEGNIAKAWESGLCFSDDYPDPITEPGLYYDQCLSEGISPETLERIRMKSRLYFGYRISKAHKPLAVIIVESTQPHRYDYNQLKDMFNKQEQYLCYLVDSLSRWMPNINEARQKGF